MDGTELKIPQIIKDYGVMCLTVEVPESIWKVIQITNLEDPWMLKQ